MELAVSRANADAASAGVCALTEPDTALDDLAAIWTAKLRHDGYCVIPSLLPASLVQTLDADLSSAFEQTPFCSGGFYGERTKRFGGLLKRSRHAAAAVQHDLVLRIVDTVLSPWCDTVQLNLTQALALHPGAPAQLPHRDQDMWGAPKGELEYLVNVMWPFTEYRTDNGATVLWPHSHGKAALAPPPSEPPTIGTCQPGSALLMLGSTLHGGGRNISRGVRRGMIVSYCLGWLKPFENQWLVYPPAIARSFSADLAGLVGYRQHRPNLGNVEGRCPSLLLRPGPKDPMGAADALRPEQEARVARHLGSQAEGAR